MWECLESCLTRLAQILRHKEASKTNFESWVRWLLKPTLEEVGYEPSVENESHRRAKFRALVIAAMVRFENMEVIAKMADKYQTVSV